MRFSLAIAFACVVLLTSARTASAYTAGWNGGTTLQAYNWNTWQYATFPWTASSSVSYVKVYDGSWYTRVDSANHQAKTVSDWPAYSSYLSAHVTTTLYSGGVYMGSYTSLNGSCAIPQWDIWWCDAGTLGWLFYGAGSGSADATVTIVGGGWAPYGGTGSSGWFHWSAP